MLPSRTKRKERAGRSHEHLRIQFSTVRKRPSIFDATKPEQNQTVFDQSHIRNVLELIYSVCSARFSFPAERIILTLLARRSDYMSVPAVHPILLNFLTQ
jgi:hypothetical protein